MSSKFEGWTNSATYLAQFYMRNESAVYNRIATMMKMAPMTAEKMAVVMASVLVRKESQSEMICGVVGNTVHLDHWAEGEINWQEIADVFNSEFEVTPDPVSSELQQLMAEAVIDGNVVRFERKFDRKTYTMVDDAMQAIGGKWVKKEKGHVFASDPSDLIESIIETGTFERPKKQDNFGYFPTPSVLAEELVRKAGIAERWHPESGMRVLEPEAGNGAIAEKVALIVGHGNVVTLELQDSHATTLRQKGFNPIVGDFLAFDTDERFFAVVMNPPFEKQADIDHVTHAWKFVAPGGVLAAIMAASVTFRDNNKTRDFRAFVESHGGEIIDNPDGSFKSSGTGVRTVTVVVNKPGSPVLAKTAAQIDFWAEDKAVCA